MGAARGPDLLQCVGQHLSILLAKGQPRLFAFLQAVFPVLKVPFVRFALVNRNDLLVELLNRDLDFTIEEINSGHMASQKGAFFLGWDRNNPQFDRERDFARACVRKDDLDRIRDIVRRETDKVLHHNRHFGKIDVANTLCRPVYVRLIDSYFGVAAPNDQNMMGWLRILFYDLFLNLTRNAKVHRRAVRAGVERRDWVRQVILDRFAVLDAGGTLPDNVLNRMIVLSRTPGYEWVGEDVINRGIGGIITRRLGDLQQGRRLLPQRPPGSPGVLADAVRTALARKDDRAIAMAKDPMYGYVAECLRFMPVQPGVLRFSERRQTLTGGGAKAYAIKPKTTVLCLTAAAMRDPAAFPDPGKFDPARAGRGPLQELGASACTSASAATSTRCSSPTSWPPSSASPTSAATTAWPAAASASGPPAASPTTSSWPSARPTRGNRTRLRGTEALERGPRRSRARVGRNPKP